MRFYRAHTHPSLMAQRKESCFNETAAKLAHFSIYVIKNAGLHQSAVSGKQHRHHNSMIEGLLEEGMMRKIRMSICCTTVSSAHCNDTYAYAVP